MSDIQDDPAKRRANMRHEVSLPAVAIDPVCGKFECEIEDVSAMGLALRMDMITPIPGKEPLRKGARIDLSFAQNLQGAPQTTVTAPCTIMWRSPIAFGVRFVEVDEALRAALKFIAETAVNEHAAAKSEEHGLSSAEQDRIILECLKTIKKLLPNLIWAFRTELTRLLTAKAEEADRKSAEKLRADATLIDDKAAAISRTIEHRFLQCFAAASGMEETQELAASYLQKTLGRTTVGQPEKLAIDEAAERKARVVSLGQVAEERFKKKFFDLDVRLANVIEHPLNREQNPLAPAVAFGILWDATVTYCDSTEVQGLIPLAIRSRVIPLIGEMYEALLKTLDDAGAKHIFNLNR
jgi:hypothetical protein